jgi:hypothetical protein
MNDIYKIWNKTTMTSYHPIYAAFWWNLMSFIRFRWQMHILLDTLMRYAYFFLARFLKPLNARKEMRTFWPYSGSPICENKWNICSGYNIYYKLVCSLYHITLKYLFRWQQKPSGGSFWIKWLMKKVRWIWYYRKLSFIR